MKTLIQFKNKEVIQGLNLEEEQITSLFTNDVTVINTDELKFFCSKAKYKLYYGRERGREKECGLIISMVWCLKKEIQ